MTMLTMHKPDELEPPAKKRDWTEMLMHGLIAVVISLGINVGSALWYFGSMNTRQLNSEERIKVLESTYVTRNDQASRDALAVIQRQEQELRLNRMDDKLDRLIEMELKRTSK